MDFVPMTSIEKKPDKYVEQCTDWVATEKVHGSSFQIYSKDGVKVHVGSRRRALDCDSSFIRCNIKELLKSYEECSLKLYHLIKSGERWARYREPFEGFNNDDEEEEDNGADGEDNEDVDDSGGKENGEQCSKDESECENGGNEQCHVRIYGELYGGGGVKKDVKFAAQKEIIYCDDFRFYVFGLTVNRKWLTIAELSDLCEKSGFPYYAKAVCEPMKTLEELKTWLMDSGFMRSRSAMTDKTDDEKTAIEGVVMAPLTRPDYRLHAVKFLAPAFNDVRDAQFGKTKTANFCTKQRYYSVISKLDTHERYNTQMVVDMFIADVIKESNQNPTGKLKDVWSKMVTQWLREDGYTVNKEEAKLEEDNEDLFGGGLFD